MHQPMPDDDPGGWDANGSPISEPTPTPRPFHPLMREQRAPHTCWICERHQPRASTPGGMWLVALVIGNSGRVVRVWACSPCCQEMALALMYGYVQVERWYHDHGYHGDAA